jgi:hypothetical protein
VIENRLRLHGFPLGVTPSVPRQVCPAASGKGMLSQNYLLYYAASCGLFSLRHSHGNDLIAVPAVDFEIGVECNYLCRTVNLEASVGQ